LFVFWRIKISQLTFLISMLKNPFYWKFIWSSNDLCLSSNLKKDTIYWTHLAWSARTLSYVPSRTFANKRSYSAFWIIFMRKCHSYGMRLSPFLNIKSLKEALSLTNTRNLSSFFPLQIFKYILIMKDQIQRCHRGLKKKVKTSLN